MPKPWEAEYSRGMNVNEVLFDGDKATGARVSCCGHQFDHHPSRRGLRGERVNNDPRRKACCVVGRRE